MIRFLSLATIIFVFSSSALDKSQITREPTRTAKLFLRNNWKIQSSAKVEEKGNTISQNHFLPTSWYPTTVPSTVVGTLVENKVYPDPVSHTRLLLSDRRKLLAPANA